MGMVQLSFTLIMEGNADVNAAREDGVTALMLASQQGNDAVVYYLLIKEGNADANAARENGVTALMLASQNGHDAVVSY